MKLLIVDDEKIILNGLMNLNWAEIGIDVLISADNGESAFNHLRTEEPDILLSDIDMPGMSGLQLAEKVKEFGMDTKVILLSGYDSFAFAQQAIRYNVFEYLLKPCSMKDIMNSVKRAEDDLLRSRENHSISENHYDSIVRNDADAGTISQILDYIEKNYMHEVTLKSMGGELHYSTTYLSKLIKDKTNCNFMKLLTDTRMKKAAELLVKTDLKVYAICERVGILDQRYFSQVFRKQYSETPLEYRKNHR